MNAWLKRCVFNLDLNRGSVSEPVNIIRKSIPEFREPNMKKFYLL